MKRAKSLIFSGLLLTLNVEAREELTIVSPPSLASFSTYVSLEVNKEFKFPKAKIELRTSEQGFMQKTHLIGHR